MDIEAIIAADEEGTKFRVDTYPGVAFHFHSVETYIEGHEWCYEDEIPTGNVFMVMVGDDRKHVVDPDYVSALNENEYCGVCGQIGCNHNF